MVAICQRSSTKVNDIGNAFGVKRNIPTMRNYLMIPNPPEISIPQFPTMQDGQLPL